MAITKQQLDKDKELLLQSALPIGTLLQSKSRKYYVVEVLGGGGFGITYKVYANEMIGNIPQKIFFVIKEYFIKGCFRTENGISVKYASNLKKEFEQSRTDFVLEADRLNKLGKLSPNIVKVNEHFDANSTSYYVMEYLDGGDLRHYVSRNGALSESEALSKIIPIDRAVEHLHKDGMLHLDIKPDNIVLKEDATTGEVIPVLIDFGIAKHFDRHGKPTSRPIAKGASDGYAPMEQYTEITKFAPEIDVYALGATLFFCLTNTNPPKAFDIPSNDTLLAKLPTGVSQRVKDAIVNAMQRCSHDRTKNVRPFLSSIEQVYTLPIGTELRSSTQKYRIVEILGETSLYIKYKAMLSNGSKTNNNSVLMGDETTVLAQYYIFEWFEKDKDKRHDSTNLQKQSFREFGSEHIAVFVREMHKQIPSKYFVEKDNHGRFKAEEFRANNTYYYSCAIIPRPIVFKALLEMFRNVFHAVSKGIRRNVKLLLLLGIFIFTVVAVVGNLEMLKRLSVQVIEYVKEKTMQEIENNKDSENKTNSSTSLMEKNETGKEKTEAETKLQPIEQTKERKEKTDDELFREAKTISQFKVLADKGYKKAYYPLANKYFADGYNKEAEKWAVKCISMNVDVDQAKSLLKKIEEKNVQKALSEKDWTVVKYYADKGCQSTYAPLAKHYLDSKNYVLADSYAQKAISLGLGTSIAKNVMEMLDLLGFYDDKVRPAVLTKR